MTKPKFSSTVQCLLNLCRAIHGITTVCQIKWCEVLRQKPGVFVEVLHIKGCWLPFVVYPCTLYSFPMSQSVNQTQRMGNIGNTKLCKKFTQEHQSHPMFPNSQAPGQHPAGRIRPGQSATSHAAASTPQEATHVNHGHPCVLIGLRVGRLI